MTSLFLLIPIHFILYPSQHNYLIDFFQNKLSLDGFLNLTSLNFVISPSKVHDFSNKFSNNTVTLREFFGIDSKTKNQTFNFDFLAKVTNLSTPISSMISNKTVSEIKSSLDDAIYFAENYPEFFKVINISPMHWRSLFISFKNDFEGMTISRSLATIGINIEHIFKKVNLIFSSLSNTAYSDKLTIESLHNQLNFKPSDSYIDLSSNLRQLSNNSIIISPRFFSNFITSLSVYTYSLIRFTFELCDSIISSTFSIFFSIFDFIDFPIRERIVFFRNGVEKLRRAPDDSLFKRLILQKIEFLNELSFYMNNFLNNEFKTSDFFVNFLKIEEESYEKGIHFIDNFLRNASIIDGFGENSPIGKFLTNFVQNLTFLKKDASLKFLFSSKESFRKAMKRVSDLSDENHEVQLFVRLQKSLQKIMNGDSNFEKEFNFDAKKINSIVKDLKLLTFRQFLSNNGFDEISNKIENVGSLFVYVSNIQKKLFTHKNIQLFDKIGSIGNLLKKSETKASSILDAFDDGLSIVIDVLFNFTSSIINKKSPSEVINSISKNFLDVEKTVNNIIEFDQNKRLSLKNFNDLISIKTDPKLKTKIFTFCDLCPINGLLQFVSKISTIYKEKNDIKISDLTEGNNGINNFFYSTLNYTKKAVLTPVIEIVKICHQKYVKSNIDIDSTIEKLRGFVRFIINDRKVGIDTFNNIFVTITPVSNKSSESKKALYIVLPVLAFAILTIAALIVIVLKVTRTTDNFADKNQTDSIELDSTEFKDNDLLLQSSVSNEKY